MRYLVCAVLMLSGQSALADTVFAKETIRARQVISAESVVLKDVYTVGAVDTLAGAIGSEARRMIYAGHAIMTTNITRAAAIERNQIAMATFAQNGLTISTEARALERGAVGDVIRAMNLTSRNTIRAEVMADGTLRVLP